ncbi:MAG: O-methyltransferase [Clostridia bacterium]
MNEYLKKLKNESQVANIPILLDETKDFLCKILKETKPHIVLEIGTAVGFSGSIILKTCPTAKLVTIEKDEQSFNKAKQTFKSVEVSDRVTQYLGDAKIILDKLCKNNQKFDFVFLDGPKGQYLFYLPKILQLLTKDGVLFADNIAYHNKTFAEGFVPHKHRTIVIRLRKFIEELKNNSKLSTQYYNVGDGVIVSKVNKIIKVSVKKCNIDNF